MKTSWKTLFAASTVLCAGAVPAAADGNLNLYCSVQVEWCEAIVAQFQKDSGVKVAMSQKGSGETLAQIRAEAQNPKGDIWFGGTGDPHLAAAEADLTEAYESPRLTELHDWAIRQHKAGQGRTVGIYSGAIGFGINTELLAEKKLEAPKCWSDLIKPEFKDEIQVANPNSSGTAYVIIATLVQLMGEDNAMKYLGELHKNVNSYAKSGTGPIKAVARGETAVSLSFVHDAVTEKNAGFPVEYSIPCEGTGFEIGSMSILKGARNMDNAKIFYDWALTPTAQKLGYEVGKQLQMPSSKEAPLPPGAPDLSRFNLIEYDFVKYGSEAERKRLIARWDNEVGSQPK